jgi:hypothetical protein
MNENKYFFSLSCFCHDLVTARQSITNTTSLLNSSVYYLNLLLGHQSYLKLDFELFGISIALVLAIEES